MKNKDFIYTRDLDILVGSNKGWRNLMQSMISVIDDYLYDGNPTGLYISYVKDKYGRLRCEYSGGDDYLNSLLSITEDLSEYIK